MPLYEYKCDTCGMFEQWRAIAELETPTHCPTCQAVAKRVFCVPNVNLNSGSLRLRGREASEPQVVKRTQNKESTTPKYSQQRNGRPWMVSH